MNTPRNVLSATNTAVTLMVTTIIFLAIYASAQQVYRQTANDPQIQIAEDAVAQLEAGADPKALVPTQSVDISKSLDTFIIITDSNGKIISSSAVLDGKQPVPPIGALTKVKSGGQNRITWEPKSGARMAIVVEGAKNGTDYVILGRSLRITEERISSLTDLVGIAWLVSMAIILALGLFKFMRSAPKVS